MRSLTIGLKDGHSNLQDRVIELLYIGQDGEDVKYLLMDVGPNSKSFVKDNVDPLIL